MAASVSFTLRAPTTTDAVQMRQIVTDSGVLDVNSAYLYLLLCRDFADTCVVATWEDRIVGFATGYRPPAAPHVLFVWQVAVAAEARRQGLAHRMLFELAERGFESGVRLIEATVASSNQPSRRLFQSLARSLDASFQDVPEDGFRQSDFPMGDHEAEPRIRIGPLNAPVMSEPGDCSSPVILPMQLRKTDEDQ